MTTQHTRASETEQIAALYVAESALAVQASYRDGDQKRSQRALETVRHALWPTGYEAEIAAQGRAQARLWLAAPQLLEACQAIASLANGQGRLNMLEVAGLARAAIAQTRG